MTAKNLLVELFVEELPPKALRILGESFADSIYGQLRKLDFLTDQSIKTAYCSPRRLAAHISDVLEQCPTSDQILIKLPAQVAFNSNGSPSIALSKKLAEHAATVGELTRTFEGNKELVILKRSVAGGFLYVPLGAIIEIAIHTLPIPKVMSYQLTDGWTTVNFVRPAHGLIALHGDDVVDFSILGLKSGRNTQGHRFEAKQSVIEVKNADSYAKQLLNEGAVIASFANRRADIVSQLSNAAKKAGLTLIQDEALLDEVTALVERPNVLTCQFESEFLQVPQECLILTMKANQKYFPLFDADGKLSNKFLVVSNISPPDTSKIIEGNERVVRPRLADAKFFFEQDRKQTLESRRERLKNIVYHNKLGTVWDRSERVSALARRHISEYISGQPYSGSSLSHKAQRASELSKTDLVTNMVGEFPELQGIMGRYYALNDKVDPEVAEAIREQYLPRSAGDELPKTQTGMALALADKIETICGIFYAGQRPTGTKDPFGLRRAAIGVLRICIELQLPINICELISTAQDIIESSVGHLAAQAGGSHLTTHNKQLDDEIYDYIMERLRSYYLESNSNITTEMFDAVLATKTNEPLDFDLRLRALLAFLQLPDAQSLTAANKRIVNILRKSGDGDFNTVDRDALKDQAEIDLHARMEELEKLVGPLFVSREYTTALTKLAELRTLIDTFFDNVMVLVGGEDGVKTRMNRLALLNQLRNMFGRVADLSRLPG
jgi:glycyl-tRNA synthetase beta chain